MSIKYSSSRSQIPLFLHLKSVISSLRWHCFILGISLLILGFEAVVNPAYAYIGPGLGIGSLMIVVGLGLSILLAILVIFWYPIKRMIFGRTDEDDEDDEDDEE